MEQKSQNRFLAAQVFIGGLLALFLTCLSLVIADHEATPQFVRYILSPGFVLGLRFASGDGVLDRLANVGMIALTVNFLYYGLLACLFFRWFNWPRMPKDPWRHWTK
jgi:hypothetical protein